MTAAVATPPVLSPPLFPQPYLSPLPTDSLTPTPAQHDHGSSAHRVDRDDAAPVGKVALPVRDDDVPSWSSEPDVGVRKTATGLLPLAGRAAAVLARGLVEVISGHRAAGQLRTHCAPEVFAGLPGQLSAPLALPHLLSVRVCEPTDGVAEVSAVFRRGGDVHAVAFRLEGLDGRWRMTALQLG